MNIEQSGMTPCMILNLIYFFQKMPEHYSFVEDCRSEFPQFGVPKDPIRKKAKIS